jgi:hypothetical protein
MKTLDPVVACQKCGERVDVRKMQRNNERACPCCKEPIVYLIELDRCNWTSGDFFPEKGEQ